jgi:hypothetical protein
MEFQIYKLNCYSITDIKAEEAKETYKDIDEVVELLKINQGYNERLYEKQIYKFYLDIEVEGLEIEKIQESLIDYFTNKLKLKLTTKDIKYTTNDRKFNKCGSYHITIPKYYSELENLKLIAIDINTLYNFDSNSEVHKSQLNIPFFSDPLKIWRGMIIFLELQQEFALLEIDFCW